MGVMMSVESSSSIEVYLISALFTPRELGSFRLRESFLE